MFSISLLSRSASGIMAICLIGALVACNNSENATAEKAAAEKPAATPAATAGKAETAAIEQMIAHSSRKAPDTAQSDQDSTASGNRNAAVGGVKWTVPAKWQFGPEKPMRAATYIIPAGGGDSEGAECGVFFFGAGQGGGVQANIDRWVGQFKQPDGAPSAKAAKQKEETVNGMKLTTVEVTGSYSGGPANAGMGDKTGYRLLGAIVEGPESAVFFKLTGPIKTVGGAEADFRTMLKSLGRE